MNVRKSIFSHFFIHWIINKRVPGEFTALTVGFSSFTVKIILNYEPIYRETDDKAWQLTARSTGEIKLSHWC